MNADVVKLKDATNAVAIVVHVSGNPMFVAFAEQVAARLGWSVRKVVALWRNRELELGGYYRRAKYRRADPRAFNGDHRQAGWTEASFVLTASEE